MIYLDNSATTYPKPQGVRQAHHLAAAEFALTAIHFPPDDQALDLARRRLAFEELFLFTIGLERLRQRRHASDCHCPRGRAGHPRAG